MQLLVACHSLVATGGLLRFESVGSAARKLGHTLAYMVSDNACTPEFKSELEVLSFDQAHARLWDAVLIPGAGFDAATIESFRRLRDTNFGTRVQMVLNDRQVRARFLAVNEALAPDIVVFNSEDWRAGTFQDFHGKRFHHIVGAVNTTRFQPSKRSAPRETFTIGAQLSKNGERVAAALDELPEACIVRFFGMDRGVQFAPLKARYGERVEYTGPKFGDDLAAYYSALDVMVSVEEGAGWANVVAEAMASGVPVVTTRAGTLSIAKPGETALVLNDTETSTIVAALDEVRLNSVAARERATRARAHILSFDWDSYARRLLNSIEQYDGKAHYSHAPEFGMYGKAEVSQRLDGLDDLLSACAGQTVLDLGAAEGFVGKEFAQRGALRVNAFEVDAGRVQLGSMLWRDLPNFTLQQGDLTNAADRARVAKMAPAGGYDVVLYLGVHQHLPSGAAHDVLRSVLQLARSIIAIRMPPKHWSGVTGMLAEAGFVEIARSEPAPDSFASPLWVLKRA